VESYHAMRDMLEDGTVLGDWQCIDVVKCWIHRRNILTYETGMGKTYVIAAAMRGFINQVPSRRFVMFIENSQIIQTPDDIRRLTGLSVLAVTGQADDVYSSLVNSNFLKYQVLMLTHSTLQNRQVMSLLYQHIKAYFGVVVDEAHKLSNFTQSISGSMMRALLRNFEARFMLSATPATTSVDQIARLIHMIDWEALPDVKDYIRDMENGSKPAEDFPELFIDRDRRSLGISNNYEPHVSVLEPHEWQKTIKGNSAAATIKGEGAYNLVNEVMRVIRSNAGKRGLIYIRNHSIREWIIPFLEKEGFAVDYINGRITSREKRSQIQTDFAKGKLDLVITSVTTGLNLDCEYVIFLNFTADIKQMIGRAERGLNPKTLHLYFIFIGDTVEIPQFMETIYNKSLIIQEVMKRDYSLLIQAGNQALSILQRR
jgi:superfamily II DNA or RNA helicase